jgi:hypothetical protein
MLMTSTALMDLMLLAACCQVAASPTEPPAVEPARKAAAAVPETGSRLEVVAGFVETRRMPSPQATQAAAADTRHCYAISNTTIATHDRRTGRLVNTATAPGTQHLNSGFFHEGKLYCAHSNYPAMPHESDIRVFDPATGSLQVFHRFPDPPGSLVWCLHHEGNWWCCFAWYGKDNARSLLVEYADGGLDRERRRFRFPDEVVADFDGMSASGGIWQGETLLASHHHFPVLYRLALPGPEAGGREPPALDLVETLACPFPGQGIASDPVTGGLVGIDRTTREIVLARPLRQPPCCEAAPRSRRALLEEAFEEAR